MQELHWLVWYRKSPIRLLSWFNSDITFFDPSKHYVRPIPQAFIDMLQHDDGTNLTDAEKAAWQNPGYVGASDTDVQ